MVVAEAHTQAVTLQEQVAVVEVPVPQEYEAERVHQQLLVLVVLEQHLPFLVLL
jgi:hypothetical protein